MVVWECDGSMGMWKVSSPHYITYTCTSNNCYISGDGCDEGSYRLIPNPSYRLIPNPSSYLYDYDYDSDNSPPYGRVELCSNGDWISVCSNGFEQEEAEAICTDIGYYRTGKKQ